MQPNNVLVIGLTAQMDASTLINPIELDPNKIWIWFDWWFDC